MKDITAVINSLLPEGYLSNLTEEGCVVITGSDKRLRRDTEQLAIRIFTEFPNVQCVEWCGVRFERKTFQSFFSLL
jgi:hypothetical protein